MSFHRGFFSIYFVWFCLIKFRSRVPLSLLLTFILGVFPVLYDDQTSLIMYLVPGKRKNIMKFLFIPVNISSRGFFWVFVLNLIWSVLFFYLILKLVDFGCKLFFRLLFALFYGVFT